MARSKGFSKACRARLVNHPRNKIAIHQVSELVGSAYSNAFSINNITAGLKLLG